MLPAIQTLLLALLLLQFSFSPETNFKANCSAAPCKGPAANPAALCSALTRGEPPGTLSGAFAAPPQSSELPKLFAQQHVPFCPFLTGLREYAVAQASGFVLLLGASVGAQR